MRFLILLLALPLFAFVTRGEIPSALVLDNVPAIPTQLEEDVRPYLEARTAAFQSWHPVKREMLITTRFADTAQLHFVRQPNGARQQLTFLSEPVGGGAFQPKTGGYILYSQDTGGGEFYQLYRFDPSHGKSTLLTDGRSRNTGPRLADSGKWIAYSSTRRNGKDTDIRVMDPADPTSDRLLLECDGGGWTATDWSPDETELIVHQSVSINESYLHLVDVGTGQAKPITPRAQKKVAYGSAQFARDGKSIFTVTDKDSEFRRLARIDLETLQLQRLSDDLDWDVEGFQVSPDGNRLAFVTNEDGASVLRVIRTRRSRRTSPFPLPHGVISGLEWHENGRDLGFTFSSAHSSSDAYSVDVTNRKLTRWTESETGGLDPKKFVGSELIKLRSFDGVTISAFVYRPDTNRFPGKRPVLVNIHGGPEGQTRPGFLGRNNYLLNELGVALIFPNVRGSSGYGKTFLDLDNGLKREDSVKDIGTILQWIRESNDLDPERIGVTGGSYGGYMVLACMIHFADQLRAGVDVVGISNFLTFLKNTQDYRRDLRRVEYGDERDPEMRAFLDRISPATQASRIKKPLFVVQGQNDPRVPATESAQMVDAVRKSGGQVWYLLAKDEGHGFRKKPNIDFQFLATAFFLRQHLLP